MRHTTSKNLLADRSAVLATEIGLLLLCVGVPLAFGGVHEGTTMAAAVVACLTMGALWMHRRATHRGLRLPWFGAVLLGVTAFTAFQMVPLPVGLLRIIAPATVETLEVSLAGAGGLSGWHPISLDPTATYWATLRVGICGLAFIATHNYAYRRHRRERILAALVLGGVVVTTVGLVGAVAAPGMPLMFYTPDGGPAGGLITTSFVNPNHGAAFLMLCTAIAVGSAIGAEELQARVRFGLAGVMLGAGVFLTLSRGGILALALALGALAIYLYLWSNRPGTKRRLSAAVVPGALALILALSSWLAFDAIVSEFAHTIPELNTDLGKIGLWAPGLSMALANPWVGVGRGAFLTTFPRYLFGEMSRGATYSHLENQYLHLPAEWGFPVATILVLASAAAYVAWTKRTDRSPRLAAAAAGLIALAGHAWFDFNLEVLGVALPAAILAGMLSAGIGEQRSSSDDGDGKTGSRGKRGRGPVQTGTVLASSVGLLGIGLAGFVVMGKSADEDLARIGRLVRAKAPIGRVMNAIRASIRRHPADPMPHLAAGRLAAAHRQPGALAWLNRATFLFPNSPDVHLETARTLRKLGKKKQTLLEYRLALANGAVTHSTFQECLPLARDPADLERVLPDEPRFHVAAARFLVQRKRVALALTVVSRARKRWFRDLALAMEEVDVLIAARQRQAAWEKARAIARREDSPDAYRLWGRAGALAGSKQEIQVLRAAHRRFAEDPWFALALASAYIRSHQLAKATKLVNEVQQTTSKPSILATTHELLARIHTADGRIHRARYEAEQARRIRGKK